MPFEFIGDLESSYLVSLFFGIIAVVYAILKFVRDTKKEKSDTFEHSRLEQFKKDICEDIHNISHRIDTNVLRLNNLSDRLSRLEGMIDTMRQDYRTPIKRYKYDKSYESNNQEDYNNGS